MAHPAANPAQRTASSQNCGNKFFIIYIIYWYKLFLSGLHDGTQEGLFLEAPNRVPVGSVDVARREDVAIALKVKAARIVTIRSN